MLSRLTLARGLLFIVISIMLVTPAAAQTSIQQRPQTQMQQLQQQQGGPSISGPKRRIPGGPGSFTSLSGTEEADFCCKSGQGGQGNQCSEFDPKKFSCTDFTLHCDGSWSCQPGGTSCQCL